MENLQSLWKACKLSPTILPIWNTAELAVVSDITPEMFEVFCAQLSALASKTQSHTIGTSRFLFAAIGEKLYSAQYVPNTKELRVVGEAGNAYLDTLPEAAKDGSIKPLLSQLKLAQIKADCGMSYVLRAAEGSFVVIDGGDDDYEESERLFDLLCAQSGGKPRIAAWFITHLHPDHTDVLCALWNAHKNEIELERLVYNMVPENYLNSPYPHERFDRLLPELEANGVALITAHTGMHFSFCELDIELLYAPEDVYPAAFDNFNDSSIIFRATLAGKRILFLGDAMPLSSDITAKRYPAEELKSTLLQVGHHGYGGGSEALNRACDPELVLWPCPAFWYPNVRHWDSNHFLITSPHIRKTYVSGHGAITLTFPELQEETPAEQTLGYTSDPAKVRRVIDLEYESVTGGATGLVPAVFSLKEDDHGAYVGLSTEGNALIGLVPEYRLGENSFEAWITLRLVKPTGRIGVMIGNKMPNFWREGQVHWFERMEPGEPVTLQVCFDREKHAEAGGIYLALENTEIALYKVQATVL